MFRIQIAVCGIQHGFSDDGFQFLREVADTEARALADAPLIGRFLAQNHPEERCFPSAVGSHEAHTGTGTQVCRGAFEQHFGSKLFMDRFKLQHGSVRLGVRGETFGEVPAAECQRLCAHRQPGKRMTRRVRISPHTFEALVGQALFGGAGRD